VDDINEPTPCTLLYVKCWTLRTIEVVDAIVMATRIMHGQPIPSECAVVEVTTIIEGHEFEDPDYPDEQEGIEKPTYAKGNFILWHRKDIIIKTRSSPIVLPQSTEDEGTLTTAFTSPYENPPKTTPPPENPTTTQPIEHHSPQHRSPHGLSSKSPPHTTLPLQNLPTEQAPLQCSPPHVHSLKPPHPTAPLQNPSTEQPPQQRSPPHVHSLKSPPHTTPPLQNSSTEQAP
jgi:hypothetical protein